MTEQHASPDAEYLCFQLGTQYFACNILQVREILQYQRPTTIPQMPGFIHGVMNLRGSVLPVIDLAQRLGHGAGRFCAAAALSSWKQAASSGQDLDCWWMRCMKSSACPRPHHAATAVWQSDPARLHCRHGHAGWPPHPAAEHGTSPVAGRDDHPGKTVS
jgi:hypothetical protein